MSRSGWSRKWWSKHLETEARSHLVPSADLGRVGNLGDASGFAGEAADYRGTGRTDDVQVMAGAALADLVADSLLQLEGPFDRLRRVARIGLPSLWGTVADLVASFALGGARVLGADHEKAWRAAEGVIDRLALRQPSLRSRPRPFPVTFGESEEMFGVKGTCCLWYRTCQAASATDYCTTCPLRSDNSRTERLRVYVDSQTPDG